MVVGQNCLTNFNEWMKQKGDKREQREDLKPEKAWLVLMLLLWQSAHSPTPTTSTVVKSLPWQKVEARSKKKKKKQKGMERWNDEEMKWWVSKAVNQNGGFYRKILIRNGTDSRVMILVCWLSWHSITSATLLNFQTYLFILP